MRTTAAKPEEKRLDGSVQTGVDQTKSRVNPTTETKPLPADAGRISDMVFQVLKYNVLRDGAVGG